MTATGDIARLSHGLQQGAQEPGPGGYVCRCGIDTRGPLGLADHMEHVHGIEELIAK